MTLRGRTLVGIAIGIALSVLLLTLVLLVGRFVTREPAGTVVNTVGETIVMRTPGGTLEIARIKSYEGLTRTDPGVGFFWGLVDTGTTVSEIDVATLYRYHIEMAKEWPMLCTPTTCVVHAGRVLPTLPPAIYSDEMRKRTASGWARFNKNENLAQLEKSMTAELAKRATSPRNMAAATSAGRRTVAEFVEAWLLKSHAAKGQPLPKVVVLFPGETLEAARQND